MRQVPQPRHNSVSSLPSSPNFMVGIDTPRGYDPAVYKPAPAPPASQQAASVRVPVRSPLPPAYVTQDTAPPMMPPSVMSSLPINAAALAGHNKTVPVAGFHSPATLEGGVLDHSHCPLYNGGYISYGSYSLQSKVSFPVPGRHAQLGSFVVKPSQSKRSASKWRVRTLFSMWSFWGFLYIAGLDVSLICRCVLARRNFQFAAPSLSNSTDPESMDAVSTAAWMAITIAAMSSIFLEITHSPLCKAAPFRGFELRRRAAMYLVLSCVGAVGLIRPLEPVPLLIPFALGAAAFYVAALRGEDDVYLAGRRKARLRYL